MDRVPLKREKFCNFCWNLGKGMELCQSHNVSHCQTLAENTCPRCRKNGHTGRYCMTPKCYRCGISGHKQFECTYRMDGGVKTATKQDTC